MAISISSCRGCNFDWRIRYRRKITMFFWRVDKSNKNSFRNGQAKPAKINMLVVLWCYLFWFKTLFQLETSLQFRKEITLWSLQHYPQSYYWTWWKWDKQVHQMSDKKMGSRYTSTSILPWRTDQIKITFNTITKWFIIDNIHFKAACLTLYFTKTTENFCDTLRYSCM